MDATEGEVNDLMEKTDENPDLASNILSCAKKTLESASLLLRRKIPCTGHLMTPRRLWMQTIPTQECDVVLMFPPVAQDLTLMWLLSRLRAGTPGLVVHVRHHASSDSYGFYLTAPFNVLLKAAEEVHLPKALRRDVGGGLKEFVQQEMSYFEGIENEQEFFSTQERQSLVLHLLQTLRAGPEDHLAGVKLIEGQAIVPKCLAAGVVSQVFPLHDPPALQRLQRSWVRTLGRKQPLDEICDYFGVKIAMYFAWLGHYTKALIIPAVVGLVFWVGLGGRGQALEDVGFVLFSFFNVLWASVYVEAWKRHSAELAYRWGTLDQRDELLVEPRPLFSGTLEVSAVTGRLEPTYPAWKRNLFRYLVSVPVIVSCLFVVFAVMISNLRLQFVNSFLSLFYIAFYLQDQEKLKQQLAVLLIVRQVIGNLKESALPYVVDQLRLAKLSFDMFGALSPSEAKKEPPGVATEADESAETPKPAGNRIVNQAELESSLFKYDGTFEDHLEIFIQMGYVVLFSSAFPMAAFCALINNLIEIRSDAFKLCFIFQRPFGQRVSSIGTWQNAMEVMNLIAVLVNCALIGLSGQVHRMFPEMSTTQTILLIVALEHIMLILRFAISCAIPDLPEWVATEMAKVEFSRREACRRLSTTTMSPPPEPAPTSAGVVIGRFVVSPAHEGSPEAREQQAVDTREATNQPEEPSPEPAAVAAASEETASTPEEANTPTANLSKAAVRKKSRDWLGPEGESLGYHLTIGPHGVDWVRRLGLDSSRKTSEPEMSGMVGHEDPPLRRSTDCIVTPKDLAASSDSDLLRSAPPWGSISRTKPKFRFSPEKEGSLSDSSRTVSSQEGEEAAATSKSDELAAKKTRVKQSLMKRARSVAIFSLKLKERRARDALAREAENRAKEKWMQSANVGGELSCIPIEKLIAVDDVARGTAGLQRRKPQSQQGGANL